MHQQTSHPLQSYWDLALGSVQAEALASAIELGLFDALCDSCGAAALAQRFGWDLRGTRNMLELLNSMGLLQRQGDADDCTYRCSELARHYLIQTSPHYCGRSIMFRVRSLRQFGLQLAAFVRDGKPQEIWFNSGPKPWAAAAQDHLAEEQRCITAEAAKAIAGNVPEIIDAKRFLDVGGGPGIVAIELARARPQLSGVVFELPDTAEVARRNIEEARLSDRLTAAGGNLAHDALGEGYDFIWCSAVLHFVPDLEAALAKLRAALRPGGVLVCAHAEIPDQPARGLAVITYYLPLLMRGLHVGREGEMRAALERSGFTGIEQFERHDFPLAPVQVLVARRSTQ